LEKLILGNLLGILELKKFLNIFSREHFKTRKILKIFNFSWKIERGKQLEIYYFLALNFQNWENYLGNLKFKKNFQTIFGRTILKLEKI
jgi:hypothetical protein